MNILVSMALSKESTALFQLNPETSPKSIKFRATILKGFVRTTRLPSRHLDQLRIPLT